MKEEEERTPLRTILQNFLNHIEKLDREKLEGSYDKEFQELKLFSEFLKTSKQYTCSQGEKEVNRKKNRYKDILPFDCSRVILEDYAGIPGSDYINANYIKGASGSPAYIASQGPLPHTVNDFWRMVVQCEVQVIVMACNEEESGKHKCENYWVEHEGEEKQFGMVAIQLMKASVVCPDFLVRTMRLKYTKNHSSTQEERTVCQFHYSAWPDHGVPPLVRPLLDMVRLVRDTQASETLPVLVHCSAGCGRTGTICAIDYVWGLLRAGKLTKDFSLFTLVREMRKQRIAMVQTKEQYVLVHHAVKELFNEQLRMIDSHPYENIDVNGMVKESPEPVYATIKFEANNEEKQDSNEKECMSQESDDAPPLPCKRKPYTAHTKQEKEVENLTQKHGCSFSEQRPGGGCSSPGTSTSSTSSSSSTCGSLLHKPRIAKLRALFERTSSRDGKSVQVKHRTPQQVTRSHSLGAVRKVEEGVMCVQPIANRGVLRVPQLAVAGDATYVRSGRPALPIKRSKSLKVLSSGERNKLSVSLPGGGASQEGQAREFDGGERSELALSPKGCSPSSNKSVVSDVKPYVPSKKVTKDRFSDRKVAKNVVGESKSVSSQNIALSSRKGSEAVHLVNSPLSASEGWRRSLDSITLESDGAVLLSLPTCSQIASSGRKSEQYRLDEDAKKLLQDCRDYLSASEKCEPGKPSPEQKFQDSLMTNIHSLQHLTVEAQRKVNAVVGGLGTRERRNSFRQAISKELESSVRPHEYEACFVSKSSNSVGSKRITPSSGSDGKPETSRMKMKGFPKPVAPSMSVQGAMSSHVTPLGAFRPKPRSGKKDALSSSQCGPLDDTSVSSSKVSCSVQKDSCAGYSKPNDRTAARHITLTDSSSAALNTNTLFTENMYVKGQLEGNVGARQDLRIMPQNSLHHHSKPHNPSRVPGHRSTEGNSESCNEVRLSANPVNHESSDFKIFNVSVARKINTVSKGRFISPTLNNTKHLERPHTNETEPILSRAVCTEVPRLPPSSVNHDSSHPSSAVNEQISVKQESINGIKNSRSAEGRILCSKILPQGESDQNKSVKHEVCGANSRSKDRPDQSCVGPNVVRRVDWGAQAHPRTLVKPMWPPTGPSSHGQEHRFPNRGKAESSSAPSRGKSCVDSGAEREELHADVAGAERNAVTARGAPKLSVKQKKELIFNEGGSQDDLALCASGPGSVGSSRVRRHASVVLLRRSLIDNNDSAPLAPLTVWNQPEHGENSSESSNRQNVSKQDLEAWNVAPGVDVDMVGASIKPSRGNGIKILSLVISWEEYEQYNSQLFAKQNLANTF
ncbi:Tyrosine-protein phosphatase Lar, partial [Gryllus bimaculatus]